jgi:CRP-like cAMP-binding protein
MVCGSITPAAPPPHRPRALPDMKTPPSPPADSEDSALSPLDFGDRADDPAGAVVWATRAAALGARPQPRESAMVLFGQLWRSDSHGFALTEDETLKLAQFLEFSRVPAGAELIAQHERGDYLLIVLEGRISVEHVHPTGERPRLAEARAGDMLGEMSLLDAGTRSTTCTTRTPCIVGVLESSRLAEMMEREPRLALAMVAALARRLSLRLREMSTRLSALLSGA